MGGEPTIHPQLKTILDIARKHRFTLSMSTNGLFAPELNSYFNRILIESINFSYPQDQVKSQEMEIFRQNLKKTIFKSIPVVLSGVLYPDRDDWHQVIDLAKDFQNKVIVRFSMVLPGHQKSFSSEEFRHYIHGLARQILNIAHYAYENYVVFFFYRPLLLCMFNSQELAFLKSISPFLFDSICSCSCVEGTMMTVNPDLSCSPCPSLFLRGLKITPEITREDIRQDFRARLKQVSIKPLLDSCQTCNFFTNYKHHLENSTLDLAKNIVCQSGCFQYRV
ncbi:MAG: hypothetical protein AMJ95_01215 [Omnitrophica WOR_2 bacterium SM23_72]|nr:MAG: hypothetical protein AMJ95_01215 [Omnitrophica WOR_2 bacterium SM23_72]